MKPFWMGGVFFGILFAVLFSLRNSLFTPGSPPQSPPLPTDRSAGAGKDRWMNILQNGRKIGFSRSILEKTADGYHLTETLNLGLTTMGMVQNLSATIDGRLRPDHTLAAIDVQIHSGRFRFTAQGAVSDHTLIIHTESAGNRDAIRIPLKEPLYLFAGIIEALGARDAQPGEKRTYSIFDPLTLGRAPLETHIREWEPLDLNGRMHKAQKIVLRFKGVTQTAWIGEDGDILKESGMLGISMERTTRDDALFGIPAASSQDLAAVASIRSNLTIEHPAHLEMLTVKLDGGNFDPAHLNGGRQTYRDGLLTVRKESIPAPTRRAEDFPDPVGEFLDPAPLIQSDHPTVRALAQEITAGSGSRLSKVVKLIAWIDRHIEKRPVLALPDALSTLEHRMGDCNEHAVLLAALARAAQIPAKLEAGVVYLDGRFYYHAWNSLFLGQWISADAALGQFPADVTHLRFSSGSDHLPLDLIGLIGQIRIQIIRLE